MSKDIQNPGSALGEAIGHLMENALAEYLEPIAADHNCRMITSGPINRKTGKPTKLLLLDEYGTKYSIDGIITNEENQPLIILESKYIRYKKHNRDKGSWICHAHNSIRSHYNSIRSSIAILAGSWSTTSIKMIKSHNVNIFYIQFDIIADILEFYGINFRWGEKDRHLADDAWNTFNSLSDATKLEIGLKIIHSIKDDLSNLVSKTLNDETEREIAELVLEVHTTLGEVRKFRFENIQDTLDFLEDFSFDEIMCNSNSFDIFYRPTKDLNED